MINAKKAGEDVRCSIRGFAVYVRAVGAERKVVVVFLDDSLGLDRAGRLEFVVAVFGRANPAAGKVSIGELHTCCNPVDR